MLSIGSLNTRGLPLFGSRLAARYRAIGEYFEASDLDVVNFQEVLTYRHWMLLRKHLPSYQYCVLRPSVIGPAGGLVTMSRLRIAGKEYRRFPMAPGGRLPLRARIWAPMKGILTSSIAEPAVRVVNTHLVANFDGGLVGGEPVLRVASRATRDGCFGRRFGSFGRHR